LHKTPRFLVLTIGYAILLGACFLGALLLRFEGEVPLRFRTGGLIAAPVFLVLSLAGFYAAGLFHGLWRYASTVTLFQVFKGATLSALSLVLITLFSAEPLFPRSLIVIVWLLEIVVVGGVRFVWRLSRERVLGYEPQRAIHTVVVGADHTGVHLIQEMRRGPAGPEMLTPVGFIDDDARLTGHEVEGVKVLGTIADLPVVLRDQRAELLIVSDPSMPAKVVREIARVCAEEGVAVKTLPGLSDLQHGRTALSQMRDVRIEDLLGRQPVNLDLEEVGEFLRGKRVLVTGAGGSIGSELARQIAGFSPAELVLLDHAENGLYFVHHELIAQHQALPVHPIVCDIRDAEGLERVFGTFRPVVVFHAAAHKHVPLLEASPREAVLNNVTGTRQLVDASDRHGVQKFVLISTDKAVNPTSVMGASKRVCEMLCQSRSQHSATRFVAVRFGNVLGSDGSVIPLFQRQLQRGGPITVTHPDARRYFMTIPEAVRLVLQAGAMGRGGEVFLLDMGEQVRIVDLARQLVRLAGMREGEDVEIVFTGLRPGEKLYEELHSDSERTRITQHQRILIWDMDARDEAGLLTEVAELEGVAATGDPVAVKSMLHHIVPEYLEPRHEPLEQVAPLPSTPVIELPATAPVERVRPATPPWGERARRFVEAAIAVAMLTLSIPLWLLLGLEARRRGVRETLLREMRIGRTRRTGPRRVRREATPIDRRSIQRRTQDLLGEPIACDRFRSDLGPISRWVARHRLDKLPYLLNVLRGEMALVGPKPEKQEFVQRWKHVAPDYARRFSVLPGVTGLAQVSGCADDTTEGVAHRVGFDLHYVEHRSLLLDLRILLRTVTVVLRRPRADAERPGASPGRHPVAGEATPVEGVTR
jgi:FlaA1/EpsC-like NDP-sugar epimerase/lipopolysaccharide/colanic/teichoic acid biosynthesis glycosyltransferase